MKQHRLARVSDDAVLYPGHLYSADPSQRLRDSVKPRQLLDLLETRVAAE